MQVSSQRKSVWVPLTVALLAGGFSIGMLACNSSDKQAERRAGAATQEAIKNPEPAVVESAALSKNEPTTVPVTPGNSPATAPTVGPTTRKAFKPIATDHLHNAHVLIDNKLVSGAQPDDEESFKTLQSLGVKTIISVDGAAPDVELARKYGMQYVHIPIGYDGVPVEKGEQIAKAMQQYGPNGAMYIHCHHGKHRSAAAVAVACVYNGMLKPEQAESVLQTFGTGANYKGLWKAARDARPLPPGTLEAMQVTFVDKAKVSDLAEHMVKVDMHWDHLKQVKAASWKSPPDHPDLDPAHEALQLQEHFTESARLPDYADRPADYKKWMKDSDAAAAALQKALRANPLDTAGAETAFKTVAASCTSCHKAYRD